MRFLQALYGKFLPMIVMFLSLSGCMKEDYQNCPVPGGLFLAPTFTLHTVKDASGEYRDLFGETAQEQSVYLFDQSGLFVRNITEKGPFTNGHLTRLDLPEGSYRAVIWVNASEDHFDLNQEPVAGETSIDDLLLQLKELDSQVITNHFSSLLYGTTDCFTVEEATTRAVDKVVIPVSLICSSNKIQVIIRWREKGKTLCGKPHHTDETYVYILDKNGVLDFDNNAGQSPWLTYIPTYFRGDALKPFIKEEPAAATVATGFSVLRLWTDSETKIRVCKKTNAQDEITVYESDLIPLIQKTGAYGKQEDIDREPIFVVELYFECDDESGDDNAWVTSSIVINGWVVSQMGDDGTDL